MRSYVYYFVEPDGSVPLFNGGDFPDDEQAVAHGAILLSHFPERHSVEVWTDETRLTTLSRAVVAESGAGERALK